MTNNLYKYQKESVNKLRSGSILCGGVGSGKSRTAIAYYLYKECGDSMCNKKDLYIITTAKKRDSLDWEKECAAFGISTERDCSVGKVKVTVDSWNNISKYVNVENAFFIFDEQRLVGSGKWVKSFIKITKTNTWILASATPGDTWSDYIPVFVANKFYKNRTEFLRRHAVYNRFTKYPKVERYVETKRLERLRDQITVHMKYDRPTTHHHRDIFVPYDKLTLKLITKNRWDPYKEQPIKTISELCYLMRKVVNTHPSRLEVVIDIFKKHKKVIVFYNFDYELELLRGLCAGSEISYAEWNGHKHQPIPKTDTWLYLVQYTAGAEGWNCIETDATIFFSQNYSYKITIQAAGRIDRLNTPFTDLYYYHIKSKAPIDLSISRALKSKKNFNMVKFIKK